MDVAEYSPSKKETVLGCIVYAGFVLVGVFLIALVTSKSLLEWLYILGVMAGTLGISLGVIGAVIDSANAVRTSIRKPILDKLDQITTRLDQLETRTVEGFDEVSNVIAEVNDAVRDVEARIQVSQQFKFRWLRRNR